MGLHGINMGLSGIIWDYMGLCGFNVGIFMIFFSLIWIYMDLYGFMWIYMTQSIGDCDIPTYISEFSWDCLGFYGIIWDYMGLYRIMWD